MNLFKAKINLKKFIIIFRFSNKIIKQLFAKLIIFFNLSLYFIPYTLFL